jgi:hypothetical protein
MRYLLIQFVRRPGGQIDEQVTVSKKIKPVDLQTMNVILDYAEKKVAKCVIEGKALNREWDVLHDYYVKIYPALIAQLEKEADISAKAK